MPLVSGTLIVASDSTVISQDRAPDIYVSPVTSLVNISLSEGPRGLKGETGHLVVTYILTASSNISGHTTVRASDGHIYVCDGTIPSHSGRCIGITTGAVAEGNEVLIQTYGTITEPSWSWVDGPVYVGANGILTQSLSGLAFIQQIGIATSPTSIDINIQLSILLS